MAELKAKVSVEKLLHNIMKKTVQKFEDDFGVRVTDVSFQWRDAMGCPATVTQVDVRTTTR